MSGRKNNLKSLYNLSKRAEADQHGIFQNFQGAVIEPNTRDKYLSEKQNVPVDRATESLYNLSPDHKDSSVAIGEAVSPHLSTRYVPGFPGLSARRIGDGVAQNPLTGEVFDYNEGFKTDDGRVFSPGDVSLQTSLLHLAGHLDSIGLVKEADYIDRLFIKNTSSS